VDSQVLTCLAWNVTLSTWPPGILTWRLLQTWF